VDLDLGGLGGWVEGFMFWKGRIKAGKVMYGGTQMV
jgi:hypothetical protein